MPQILYLVSKKAVFLLDHPGKKDLTEEIVRVTVKYGEHKLDIYILKDQVNNLKNLRANDFTEKIYGRLPKMKLKTHYKKTSEIGKMFAEALKSFEDNSDKTTEQEGLIDIFDELINCLEGMYDRAIDLARFTGGRFRLYSNRVSSLDLDNKKKNTYSSLIDDLLNEIYEDFNNASTHINNAINIFSKHKKEVENTKNK